MVEVSGGAADELPKAVSSKDPDTVPYVPDVAIEESPEDVLVEATYDVPSEAIHETLGEGILIGEPVGVREWDTNAMASPTTTLPPHAEPAQTVSPTSLASLAETPGANRISNGSTLTPTPPSYSQAVSPAPNLIARAQDELGTEVSKELSEPDQDVVPLVESSDRPSSSPSAMAQRKTSSNVPASLEIKMAEEPSSFDLPNRMSPTSSLADRSETPSPTMLHGGGSVETEGPVASSPSALEEVTRLQVPESPGSTSSQIEVASGRRPEPSGIGATDEEVPAVDSANASDAAPQAASSTAGDSDCNSDDELSSPLVRKTAHRGKGHQKSTPASNSRRTRGRSPSREHIAPSINAKGVAGTKSQPEHAIRSSYATFGLDSSQLTITYDSHPIHPLALYMGSTAKNQAELTQARMKKLDGARSELLEYLPTAGNSGADQKDTNLIRRLCLSSLRDEDTPRLVDAVKALRRRSEVAGDELNLFRCLESLMVMVTKQHNEEEVGVLVVTAKNSFR